MKVGSDAVSRTDWFELVVRTPVNADLRHRVQTLLGRGERRILLNLAGVSDLDAAGLGELVRAYNMAAASNGVLRIANTVGRARELLRRVGLFDLLDFDSERVLDDEISSLLPVVNLSDSNVDHRHTSANPPPCQHQLTGLKPACRVPWQNA